MESSGTIDLSMERLMPVMGFGVVALVAIFAILALVRIWGLKMQRKSGACGGIGLEDLRRRRDAGEISQAEYEAVLAGLTGGAAGSEGGRKTPINQKIAEEGGSERSPVDGEA